MRRKTRVVKIGNIFIGGSYPIAIQGMTKVKTAQIAKVLSQIKDLEKAGAQIVRLAIEDFKDAQAIREIKRNCNLPLVADIHFDWRLGIEVIESGIDKIRINPGNIYQRDKIKKLVDAARLNRTPIRLGLNSGSLRIVKSSLKTKSMGELLVAQAKEYLRFLEKQRFYDIVISLKGSDLKETLWAYEKMAKECDYPFHIGLTATGNALWGIVSSSMLAGILLREGIGDTLRVSLTDSCVQEIKVARYILAALGFIDFGPRIISCPTCGRCKVNLVKMVKELEEKLDEQYSFDNLSLKIAVMGCVVNGPGEAKHADLGVAFGRKDGLLFRKGVGLRKVASHNCTKVLLEEIKRIK